MYKFIHGLLPLNLMITFAHNLTSIHTTQEQQVTLHYVFPLLEPTEERNH